MTRWPGRERWNKWPVDPVTQWPSSMSAVDSEVRNQNSPRRVDRRKCCLFSLTDDRRQFIILSIDPLCVCVQCDRLDAARRAGPSAVAEIYPYHLSSQTFSLLSFVLRAFQIIFNSSSLGVINDYALYRCTHVLTLLLILCRADTDIKVGVPSFSWTKKGWVLWPISWMASVLRCHYSVSWVTHGRKGLWNTCFNLFIQSQPTRIDSRKIRYDTIRDAILTCAQKPT